VQESDELYLLSQESDASVKVRDGLMDVKRLEAVDGNGLEQWRPVLKGLFPLGAADLRTVLGALAVSVPELAREAYTLEQLVDEVVGASPALAALAVHKRRVHYQLGDCMAELSEVTAGTRSARTIAVEAEDPELVAATVRELQLAERPNVCLARGLKTMLGLEPVRFAVIDVGTNSVKLHVGERRADDSWQTVADRAEVTRLGEGLQDTGSLQPEPLRRTADAVVGMAQASEHVVVVLERVGVDRAEADAEVFGVTALDGTSKQVSFTIHGANDAAAIGEPAVHDVTEDVNANGNLTASGTISGAPARARRNISSASRLGPADRFATGSPPVSSTLPMPEAAHLASASSKPRASRALPARCTSGDADRTSRTDGTKATGSASREPVRSVSVSAATRSSSRTASARPRMRSRDSASCGDGVTTSTVTVHSRPARRARSRSVKRRAGAPREPHRPCTRGSSSWDRTPGW